ncbi:MAG: 3-phosphoshikimate 1-carboxyvinyltransferase [Chlamydiia bacterium]|nr:3-phosphoshikimate 1-carboxyvinyltransferase [Chlamydiia bacterium]MCH9615635.1 3-phosphoshikimate 1-carboxyvinyltransferase [Chlamydiia bacterium]MCH9628962.1 3-phosphoshikimate 1-carboxyvinyltransferase [Chlamydiia bacterium]
MPHALVKRSTLKGSISIPPSKSHTHRAILFAMMGRGQSRITNYLNSPDSIAMIEAAKQLGAKVEQNPGELIIDGAFPLNAASDVIQCGNSGLVLRLVGALAGLMPTYTVITGDHSIRTNRVVSPLLHALSKLGAFATSSRGDGYAPIIVRGPIHPGKVTMSGESSQPVSGMLIASSFGTGEVVINVDNPGEKPWIDLTLSWFDFLGLKYTNDSYTRYTIPGHGSYDGFEKAIPGDLSSAAFPVAAALITGSKLRIENADMRDVQGDKELFITLQKMGANLTFEDNAILVNPSDLKGIEVDINNYVDSITILAVLGCFASGTTVIKGAAIARKKECDRIHAIVTELEKMGAKIEETEDGLIVHNSPLTGAEVESYEDHRMAMSLVCAGLGSEGETKVGPTPCISKTYPGFLDAMHKLGADLKETL